MSDSGVREHETVWIEVIIVVVITPVGDGTLVASGAVQVMVGLVFNGGIVARNETDKNLDVGTGTTVALVRSSGEDSHVEKLKNGCLWLYGAIWDFFSYMGILLFNRVEEIF